MSAAFHLLVPAGSTGQPPGEPPSPDARLEPNGRFGRCWRSIYYDSGQAVAAFLKAVETEETAELHWSG